MCSWNNRMKCRYKERQMHCYSNVMTFIKISVLMYCHHLWCYCFYHLQNCVYASIILLMHACVHHVCLTLYHFPFFVVFTMLIFDYLSLQDNKFDNQLTCTDINMSFESEDVMQNIKSALWLLMIGLTY